MSINTQEAVETKTIARRNGSQQICWGRLCGINININSKDLNKEEFSVGRGSANDLVLTLKELPMDILISTSKVHFIIKRGNYKLNRPIYIQDFSRNGTFVNYERIGQNMMRVLQDGDIISLSLPSSTAFVFMDLGLPEDLAETYDEICQIGDGAYGLVRLVKDTHTGQQFAMKIVNKYGLRARPRRDPAVNEVEIMKNLSHPCVVRMHSAVDRPRAVYILMELMPGGDLLDRLVSKKYLSEGISKLFFYQMCQGVKYIHDRNIIHRDLKMENVLLRTNDEETLLKVCDFGLSMFVRSNLLPDGTPTGAKQVYTKKVDIWSLGVVLYCLLSGKWPFLGAPNSSLGIQIKKGYFKFEGSPWNDVSADAMLLIKKILVVNPKKRPSIDGILKSSWLRDAPMQRKAEILMNLKSVESSDKNEPRSAAIKRSRTV